jgi:hypothetical protein
MELKEIEKEFLKQTISRTDKSGNEKVQMLIHFIEQHVGIKVDSALKEVREMLIDEGYEILAEKV